MSEQWETQVEDGKHVILRCAGCNKALVNIWCTRPNELDPATKKPIEWQVAAKCCYCSDVSYIKKIYGGFHFGGYGKPKKDDETTDIPETNVIDQVQYPGKSSVMLFITEKA